MKGLSKSRYTTFCQCPKALWLKIYKPELEVIDDNLQTRFAEGNEVGDLAMELFEDYVDITSFKPEGGLDLSLMIERTQIEINRGTMNICEASFSVIVGGLYHYCAVDILHKEPNGWSIYEVKSSTFKNDNEESPSKLIAYIRDIAYQKWLLEQCGINVIGTYLVRLNSNYIREGELNIKNLFHIKDMRELISEEHNNVVSKIDKALHTLLNDEPNFNIDGHCNNPYACGFFDYCTGVLPTPNVFDLYRMKFDKQCELFNDNKISFEDLQYEKLSATQRLQVESYLNGTAYINTVEIREFLKKLSFPLYFLDFETMMPAIPVFNQTRPYQQIPFQYSLHWINEEGGEIYHSEYLGNSIDDPRRELCEQLCKDIPANVCVIAYNKSFECGRLNEMAQLFPDLREHLLNISKNMVDLIEPFRSKMVYYPEFNGSFSIKQVLPALFPDEPSLDYHNLQGSVHHGGEAMSIYPAIAIMSDKDAQEARRSLLEYCKLDTYAMVKIWQKLKELAGED